MKYTGDKCFSCGETFSVDDDVVVCPECGTPYHRSCYKNAGKCLNDALHESGQSWQSAEDERKAALSSYNSNDSAQNASEDETKSPDAADDEKICPRCFAKNPPEADKCEDCGFPLPTDKEANDAAKRVADYAKAVEGMDINKEYFGFNPEEEFGDGVKLGEVAQFVGPNTLYYLPLFKRMKDLGTKVSFNLICLICPYFHFAYRKMWLWTVISAIIAVILNLPEIVYAIGMTGEEMPMLSGAAKLVYENEGFIKELISMCSTVDWGVRIVLCLFGNWLYYRYSIRSVSREKQRFGGPVSPQRLGAKGGVSFLSVILTAVIVFVASGILLFGATFVFVYMQRMGVL